MILKRDRQRNQFDRDGEVFYYGRVKLPTDTEIEIVTGVARKPLEVSWF
jgi:hypothetical protein